MYVIYGIPNCDTVRKARKWFDSMQIDYRFHDFRADGVAHAQVARWLEELGAARLINRRSPTWRSLDAATQQAAMGVDGAAVLVAHPTLIKRPVLDLGDRRLVGFSPADWQAALKDDTAARSVC